MLSHTLRSIASMPTILLGGQPMERAGEARLASRILAATGLPRIGLRSPSFPGSGPIPARFTAEGEGRAPGVTWSGVPATARSLSLLVEDPDAPTPKPFVHWLIYNLPAGLGGIPEGLDGLDGDAPEVLQGAGLGKSSMMRRAWAPCAPPEADAAHRYVFQLFALDRVLRLSGGVGRTALIEAMRGHLVGYGELFGTFAR